MQQLIVVLYSGADPEKGGQFVLKKGQHLSPASVAFQIMD